MSSIFNPLDALNYQNVFSEDDFQHLDFINKEIVIPRDERSN